MLYGLYEYVSGCPDSLKASHVLLCERQKARGTGHISGLEISGLAMLQVRTMRESRGDVTEAGPSIAVQMVGLNSVPVAGDEFSVCSSEQEVLLRLLPP